MLDRYTHRDTEPPEAEKTGFCTPKSVKSLPKYAFPVGFCQPGQTTILFTKTYVFGAKSRAFREQTAWNTTKIMKTHGEP